MIFRAATAADVPAIVALLADDPLGAAREGAPLATYMTAIAANPSHQLNVGEQGGRILATARLTMLDGLSRGGIRRCLVQTVRVAAVHRSPGHRMP